MKRFALMLVGLFLIAGISLAAEGPVASVQLHRAGAKELDAAGKATVAQWSMNFLKSANFNTLKDAEILKQSISKVQDHYRQTVSGNYAVVSYAQPVIVKTLSGEMTVVEIIVGLNRKDDIPSALFTVDPEGRVVGYEKYAGGVLPAEMMP